MDVDFQPDLPEQEVYSILHAIVDGGHITMDAQDNSAILRITGGRQSSLSHDDSRYARLMERRFATTGIVFATLMQNSGFGFHVINNAGKIAIYEAVVAAKDSPFVLSYSPVAPQPGRNAHEDILNYARILLANPSKLADFAAEADAAFSWLNMNLYGPNVVKAREIDGWER